MCTCNVVINRIVPRSSPARNRFRKKYPMYRHPSSDTAHQKKGEEVLKVHVKKIDATAHHTILMKGEEVLKVHVPKNKRGS